MTQATASSEVRDRDSQLAEVQSAIAEISHIATLPEVTVKIIRLVEDPDATAQDLNKVITYDPALGARILKVVNSVFYGLPGQIGSINRAIILLGLNAIKNIAIAASLTKLFRGGKISDQFNARDLWTHSIGVATTTHLLSDTIDLGLPDEAFLAGLIHDLGIMVEFQVRRQKFAQVIEKLNASPRTSFRELETEIVGANHEQFGSGLCRRWQFPACFADVTGFHHHPLDLVAANRTLPSLVHMADVLSARMNIGFTRTVETDEFSPELMDQLKITESQIQQVTEMVPKTIKEASAMLSHS